MRVTIIAAAIAALALASSAEATQCKDAKGHYIKCPAPAAAPQAGKAAPCKDSRGHFVKCPTQAGATKAPALNRMQPAGAGKSFTSSPQPAFRNGAPPKCKTGVPCGNSCIPKGKVCHKS